MAYLIVNSAMLFIVVCAAAIVPMIFGSQLPASVAPAQAPEVAGILTPGASSYHGLIYGLGRPGTWLVYALAIDAITVAMTFLLAPIGMAAITAGFVFVALFATVVRWPLVAHHIRVPWKRSTAQFGRAAVLSIAAGVTGIKAYNGAIPHRQLEELSATGLAISLNCLIFVHFLFPSTRGHGKRFAQVILGWMRPTLADMSFSAFRGER